MARKDGAARIHMTARLPVELVDALDQVAEARMLGRSKLVELMLLDGLARLDAVETPRSPLLCSNCDLPVAEHCDQHTIPCCPGSCDVSPLDLGEDSRS